MVTWPKDNQSSRNAFYGDPGKGEIGPQMVPVVPPFAMYYEGKRIKNIQFHRKAASSLLAALNEIWDYYGRDQKKIDAAGLSRYNGAYNHRMVRGSSTKWSNHAYAAAIDINADENGLFAQGNIPQPAIDAFLRQGWMWGGYYSGRKDPMHFEAVDNGGRKPKSPPPAWPAAITPVAFMETTSAPEDEFEDEEAPHPSSSQINDQGINVQPKNSTYDVDIEILQHKLIKLNYHEVGDPDGYWGGKTRGAVTAFMSDRGLTTDGAFTTAVSSELNKALAENWSRPISPQRANATARDIAPKVDVVRQTLLQKFWAKIAAGFAAIGFTGSSISSWFHEANEKLAPVRDFLKGVPPEVWFIIIGAVAGLAWYASSRATKAAVQDYNTGKIN